MYNLILVDDDQNQLYLNSLLFSEKKVFDKIDTYQDPVHALNHIKDKADISNDIFVVDINMPQMSAWEFLESINTECSQLKKTCLHLFVASFSSDPKDIKAANDHKLVTSFISKDNLIPSVTHFLNCKDL